jgi:hypothetical protein
MVQLKPRQYLKFLSKVNKDIDKIDTERTIEKTFCVGVIGESCTEKFDISEIENCLDGTMFLVSKN